MAARLFCELMATIVVIAIVATNATNATIIATLGS